MPVFKFSMSTDTASSYQRPNPKRKHGVRDPMPELTITSPYVDFRVDSNTFTMRNPMPESTYGLMDLGFGLCTE
jgi:hypothetical protein